MGQRGTFTVMPNAAPLSSNAIYTCNSEVIMHCLETIVRLNLEWPHPQSRAERREEIVKSHEARLGIEIDRNDPMLGATIALEAALDAWRTTRAATLVNALSSDVLKEVLDQRPSGGLFSRAGSDSKGHPTVHYFSLSVGMYCLLQEKSYVQCFNMTLPEWVKQQHPCHITHLCTLAMREGAALPQLAPWHELN